MSLGGGEARCRNFLREAVDHFTRVDFESGAEAVAFGVVNDERHCPYIVGCGEISWGVGPVSVMTAIFCSFMGCSLLCAMLLSEAFREAGWCFASVNFLV